MALKALNIFLPIENGLFFLPNPWHTKTFLNPLDVLIPKILFSFFAEFCVRVTSRAQESVSIGFRGGGLAQQPRRQAPGARIRPRQWVGGPIQALRRLPGLSPDGKSGPARVAVATTPHGGSAAHNAA